VLIKVENDETMNPTAYEEPAEIEEYYDQAFDKRLKIWKENAQKLWNYKDQKVDYYIHRYQRKKAVMH